jgi:2-polyprenyl-3-methyl-5-hydroxy-6-metoxy-1,4-benzoquinol methylase
MDLAEAKERHFDTLVRHPWELARLEVVDSLIARHAPIGEGDVVMDVGCGDLFVARQLAAGHPGATFYAIDAVFTDELMARLRSQLHVANLLAYASLDDIHPPPRHVRLMLLMDVIEHIDDDVSFLRGLLQRPSVDPGTIVLITVPAYQSLFCSHDTFLGHYRRYSNASLRAAARAAGLYVVETGTFFASLLPVRFAQVARERLLGVRSDRTTGLVTWTGSAAKSALLKEALLADARTSMWLQRLGLPLPGLSLYAVCRTSA